MHNCKLYLAISLEMIDLISIDDGEHLYLVGREPKTDGYRGEGV